MGLSLTAPSSRPEVSVNFQSDANSLTDDGNGVECHSPSLCLTETKVTLLFSPSNIVLQAQQHLLYSLIQTPTCRKICENTCPLVTTMNGEPQMSKFMSLVKKFNFYFNGKPIIHPVIHSFVKGVFFPSCYDLYISFWSSCIIYKSLWEFCSIGVKNVRWVW